MDASNGYARRGGLYLHRAVMGERQCQHIDHHNGNKLDNRRSNLRCATRSQNLANAGPKKNNTSGFKGVNRNGRHGFMARIMVDRKVHYLGTHATREDAARAYDLAALHLLGEFARLNFPGDLSPI